MTCEYDKSHIEFAQLARAAYHNCELDPNQQLHWKLLSISERSLDGYRGCAFSNTTIQVIAHRGTSNIDGLFDDLQIYFDAIPNQFRSAMKFTQLVINQSSVVHFHIGHSLGGVLAQLIATKTLAEGVVFDSPGAKTLITKLINRNLSITITEYLSYPNIINSYGTHIGVICQVPVETPTQKDINIQSYIKYSLQQHQITTLAYTMQENLAIPVDTWPTGIIDGYRAFLTYTVNQNYWDRFLVTAWEKLLNTKRHGIFNVNTLIINGDELLKEGFLDFWHFKTLIVTKYLTGKISFPTETSESDAFPKITQVLEFFDGAVKKLDQLNDQIDEKANYLFEETNKIVHSIFSDDDL